MSTALLVALGATPSFAGNQPQAWWQGSSLPTSWTPRWDFSYADFPPKSQVAVFGGAPAKPGDPWHNDTWVYSMTTQKWSQGPGAPTGLTSRGGAAMAYMPDIGKIVLFGGAGQNAWPPYADTWEFDGTKWTAGPAAPAGMQGRTGAEMVYMDSIHKLVLFGGSGTQGLNDTWLFDGTKWTAGPAAPAGMNARVFFGMAYDQAMGRVVVAGGDGGSDVWYFDGTAWTAGPAMPTAMGKRERTRMAYDPLIGGDLVFGGLGPGSANADLWLLKDGGWSLVSVHPSPKPGARVDGALVWDTVKQQFMMFGGIKDTDSGKTGLRTTWFLVSPTMTITPSAGPVGTKVTIDSGPGWERSTSVTLKLDKLVIKTVKPDANGKIHTTATVSTGTVGKVKYFKLTDDTLALQEKVGFSVTKAGGVDHGFASSSSRTGHDRAPADPPAGPELRYLATGASPDMASGQISAHDGKFWLGGSPIQLRGVNASPIQNADLTAEDYANIQSWHLNFVRMRIRWSAFEPTAPVKSGGTWIHTYDLNQLADLKNQIDLAWQHGEWVLIENYCGPPCYGNGYPDWLYSKTYNTHARAYVDATTANTDFWTDALQQQFTSDWLRWLAGQLASVPGIVGYEPLNEPALGTYAPGHTTTQMILDVELSLAQAVRGVDPWRVIFFTTHDSSGAGLPNADLSGWTALGNVAFDVHAYFGGRWGPGLLMDPANPSYGECLGDLFDFTLTSGVPPYMGTAYGQTRFARTFTDVLTPNGIPLVMGEFGGQGELEANNMNMYGSMAYGFNAAGVSWAVWTYNGAYGMLTDSGAPEPWVSVLAAAAAAP